MCHKCGKAGHLVLECPQNIFTPWKELTYRCPFCRSLGGIAAGHEWDICKDCRVIRMGKPDDNCCGICDHPGHLTPQCPAIQGPEGTILLSKMQGELLQNGWALDTSSGPTPAVINTTVQPATPSPTQPSRQWREVATNSSASSTGSTVSLPGSSDQEGQIAIANSQVYGMVREAMRHELVPIRNHLGSLSKAVETQGGNIESMTEMIDEFGSRLANVESAGAATNQKLARMRAKFQQAPPTRQAVAMDQLSEHSLDDNFQDANTYDPNFPTDYQADEPSPPGLKSPATEMPI